MSNIAIAAVIGVFVALTIVVYSALRCSAGWRIWLLYSVARLYAGLFFRWSCNKPCPIPEDGPAILISNHTSPVDPIFVWMGHSVQFQRKHHIRVPNYLMAREYFETPGLIGWISRTMQSIPVDRDGKDTAPVREALRRLKQGRLVGVFPEGGINETPHRLQPALAGTAWLALKAKCPVLPIFIKDAPRGTGMVNSFYTRSKVSVVYGDPIDLSQWDGKKPNAEVLAEVTSLIMRSLAELGGVEYSDHLPNDELATPTVDGNESSD